MRSRLRAVFPLLTLVIVVGGVSCKSKLEVSFDIELPRDVVDRTVWFEIGVYKDTPCAALDPMLKNGVPAGAAPRVAFRRDAATAPRIGDLPRASYAFAAVARGDDCGVLATGCSEANFEKTEAVSVSMRATDPPTGACGAGSSCQAAICVPANDDKDPSVGAECSLELLGAGPLASPVAGEMTTVSAPAVAVTPTGFVIAYRELDPNGTSARVTILPVDANGGAYDPKRPLLKGRCPPNADEFDGIGLVANGADGQVVLARPKCGSSTMPGGCTCGALSPGLEVLTFASKPQVTIDPNFRSSESPSAQKLTLSAGHVTARALGATVVVFTDDGSARIAPVVAGQGVGGPSGTFGGSNTTGAWVAASERVLAVLAAGPPQAALSRDGGPGEGGVDAAPLDPTPQLGLVMAPAATTAGEFDAIGNKPRAPLTFPGLWGAVAALGPRVIVLSDGSGPGRSASYRAFDLDGTEPVESSGFSVEGTGTVTTGDVTMVDDGAGGKAYFAVLKPGSVSLHVFGNATKKPRLLRDVMFAKQPRVPSVASVRDSGRVAVAATGTRVAVAWTTAKALTRNDPSGGYAVFACTK